jgi:hypothetical protein
MSTRGTRSTPAWPGGNESEGGVGGHLGGAYGRITSIGAARNGPPLPVPDRDRLAVRHRALEDPVDAAGALERPAVHARGDHDGAGQDLPQDLPGDDLGLRWDAAGGRVLDLGQDVRPALPRLQQDLDLGAVCAQVSLDCF